MSFVLPSQILFKQILAFILTKMQLSFIIVLATIASSSFAAPLPAKTGAETEAQIMKQHYPFMASHMGRRSPSPGQGMSRMQDSTKHQLAQQLHAQHANAVLNQAQIHAEIMKKGNAHAVQAIGRRSPSPGKDSNTHAMAVASAAAAAAKEHAQAVKAAFDAQDAGHFRRSDEDISLERRRTVSSAYIPVNYPV